MRSYIIIIVCLYAYSGLFDHMPVLHAGVHCVQKQEQELLVPPICRWRSLAYAKEMWVRWSWRCVFVWVNWADGDMMWEAIWTASSTLCTCVCVCVCFVSEGLRTWVCILYKVQSTLDVEAPQMFTFSLIGPYCCYCVDCGATHVQLVHDVI